MATRKPNRRDYPAGRSGAAQYAAAVRKYNTSQAITRRTQATDTRSATQRRRDARRSTTTRRTEKPETAQQRRNRQNQETANQQRRQGRMSNIPASEGSYNNPNYGKPGDPQSAVRRVQEQAFNRGASGAGTRGDQTGTFSGMSKAEINAEYDRLRKAGKTSEAEAYGKKMAKEIASKAPKNPYRAPQGAERKDRLSKAVAELKAMRRKSSTSGTTGTGPVRDGDAFAAGVRAGRRASTDPVTRYGSGARRATTRDTSKDQSRSATSRSRSSTDPVTRYGSGSRKGVTRDTSKDEKKKRQSRANRAGWSGNRNY